MAGMSSGMTNRVLPGRSVHLQRQRTTKAREELDGAFQAAVAACNWPAAAEHLNGFNDSGCPAPMSARCPHGPPSGDATWAVSHELRRTLDRADGPPTDGLSPP